MSWWKSVVLALGVAGCADDSTRIVLRMTSWQTPAENALDLPAIRAFEAAHAGVRVENEPVANQAEYREKVITSIVSGAPPDVFLLDNIDVPAFIEASVLLDLRSFAPRVGLDLSAFYPNVLGIFARGDAVYAFPKGFSPVVYYYNRALFDAAGLPYPQDGWTWEEFIATARALTRDLDGDGTPDQWGTAVMRPFYAWQAVVWSAGGDILAPDGRRATGYLDGEPTIAALEFLTSLVLTHGVAPRPNAFRAVTGNESRLFYSGRLGMLPSGHWLIPNIRPQLASGQLKLGVVGVPVRAGATPATPLFASGWAVPRNTAHRKLAVSLAAALSGPEAQRVRLEAGLELSAMPAVQDAWVSHDSLGLDAAFARVVPTGRPPWGARIAPFREVEAQLPEILDRVIIEGRPVGTVVREVARRVDQVVVR